MNIQRAVRRGWVWLAVVAAATAVVAAVVSRQQASSIGQPSLADAFREAQARVRANPRDAGAHADMAGLLAGRGNLDSAVVEYDKALQLDPTSSSVHLLKGEALARMKRMREAKKAFVDGAEASPRKPEERVWGALCGLRAADLALADRSYPEAERWYERGMAAYWASHDEWVATGMDRRNLDGHFGTNLISAARSNLATARKGASKNRPDSKWIHAHLPWLDIEPRQKSEAQSNAKEASALWKELESGASGSGLHLSLADALEANGETGEAIIQYRAALLAEPNNEIALVNLGFAYARLGRFGEAAASFQKAVDAGDDASAFTVQKMLEAERMWANNERR